MIIATKQGLVDCNKPIKVRFRAKFSFLYLKLKILSMLQLLDKQNDIVSLSQFFGISNWTNAKLAEKNVYKVV